MLFSTNNIYFCMAYEYPKIKQNADGTFGPTNTGNKYYAVDYHNKTAKTKKGKNRFILKKSEQYEVFRVADESDWNCPKNRCLFSILDNGNEVLGFMEERIAYFEPPVNIGESWHGYPVFSSEIEISEELLDNWQQNNIISLKIRKKIGKGEL